MIYSKEISKHKYILFLIFLVSLSVVAYSSDDVLPEPMRPRRLVNDFAGILKPQEQYSLERKLVDFNDSTSTQIAVAIVNDLHGYDAGDFAIRLANKWGVGQKDKNNGILILVKPKTATSNGRVFIAAGYGIEEHVPDVVAKRIISREMIPLFKEGRNYEALDKATTVLFSLVAGKFTADEYMKKRDGSWIPAIFFLSIFGISLILRIVSSVGRNKVYSPGSSIPFWMLLMMMGSGGGRGSYGSFSSGSGSFGGFGGGGFGGGGAGGSW